MYFNSRPHEEVDCFEFACIKSNCIFQLTTSRGGRPLPQIETTTAFLFQLTTSRGGRRFCQSILGFCKLFQLTTSRGGRRKQNTHCRQYTNISTHDLTRRSTVSSSPTIKLADISTHDLTRRSTFNAQRFWEVMAFQLTTSRGGRRRLSRCTWFRGLFQLTTSRGGRPGTEVVAGETTAISTHDLTRRSTSIFTQKVFLSKSLFVLIAYNIFILH